MNTVYLDGQFLPIDQARVSVMDRGFLFGDGVYEVIPSQDGKLVFLDLHLARLNSNLKALQIDYHCELQEWTDILSRLVAEHGGARCGLYLQLTRGVQQSRSHVSVPGVQPTRFAMVIQPNEGARGMRVITLPDTRWHNCEIKAITLLANVMYQQEARRQGADEALLVRDGLLTEGAASNVFVVCGTQVCTPPLEGILPGITRQVLLEILHHHQVDCQERPIPVEQLARADEIWLTGSTLQVAPVLAVDGRPVGNGEPGPAWRRALHWYQRYLQMQRGGQDVTARHIGSAGHRTGC